MTKENGKFQLNKSRRVKVIVCVCV